jgi:cytochrome c oxidase assembly factor CtaG
MWLMDLINLGFLLGATLFWWPMVGADPIPHWNMSPGLKLLNLFIGIPIEAFLGVALLLKTTSVAPMYTLTTTHMGGGVLWVATELATVAALVPLYAQWAKHDARAARRIDARLASGQPVAPPVFEGHGLFATLKALRRDI